MHITVCDEVDAATMLSNTLLLCVSDISRVSQPTSGLQRSNIRHMSTHGQWHVGLLP